MYDEVIVQQVVAQLLTKKCFLIRNIFRVRFLSYENIFN